MEGLIELIYDENESDDKKIIQYFDMHGLILCIKVDGSVSHMLYAWSFSNNTAFPITIKKNKYDLSLNRNTDIFA